MSNSCNHGVDSKQLCVEKVPIFNHLNKEEMMQVVKLSTQLHYKKGEQIFRDGDSLHYLYIVHVGSVKVYQLFPNGKEQLLRVLRTGEFMGELALFTEKEMDSYAEALEDTEICAIHRHEMQALLRTNPAIAAKILEQLSIRLEKTEKLVGQLTAQDAEARIANYLLDLVEVKQSNTIALPLSKKDLASFLGTTRETVSRRLSYFQANGWIDQKGHRDITILDKHALEALTEKA